MTFFDSAIKTAEEAWEYYHQPIVEGCLFKALPSKRDLMAELKHAREAYQLVVGKGQKGFYEELSAKERGEIS